MRSRAAWVWVIAMIVGAVAWCAPADAAVSGSLQVTAATPTTVSFTFTSKRTCTAAEQCDYFTEIDQLADASACPAAHPEGPWILWTGDVQNTGPTTESGRATPRDWTSSTATVVPTRLCMYIYADDVYYLVADAVITRPAGGPGGGQTPGGGTGTPGRPRPGGGGGTGGGGSGDGSDGTARPLGKPSPKTVTCLRYAYQQEAQKALDGDRNLAARLDRNGDGVACENLPKHKSYSSTVALRTAATATRAALRKAYGASFTKGTNYRARCARLSRTRVRCSVSWRRNGTWTGSVEIASALRRNERVVVARVHVLRPA